jgi:two-component system OmpR family response regulator
MNPGIPFSTAPGHQRPRRSILLVEDEDAFRTLLTDVLHLDGHAVHAFSDGRLALRHLEEQPVDLIVTDICMPDFDGFELLTKLRERGGGAAVLVMSGGIDSKVDFYLKTARQLGATRTLAKPFPLEQLLAIIRGMLAERG